MAKLADKTYGQALFDLGLEENKLDEFQKEVEMLCSLFHENQELCALLVHPQIPREEKEAVLSACFDGKVSDEISGFLHIVVRAGRQSEFLNIFEYFLNAVKAYKHIGTAYVTSAVPLSEAQKEKIEARLLELTDNVAYDIHYSTDAGLIGGMVIRIGDKVADSSIKTKLEMMTRDLMKIQLSE